ncbi:hypothetical protein [Bacillus sp. CGMCC 1.16541]|uniref:DUF6906 family protein n=1 Tax=Bacillus sp. CGMCC 1.16541 TaxID=2185143 RepID=UPI001951D499|nr:hypothetical protein [Bacillus sp. CGMCC 1.16541]
MKNGKRPTKKQKQQIEAAGLNSSDWLIVKNLEQELHLVHRSKMEVITISI